MNSIMNTLIFISILINYVLSIDECNIKIYEECKNIDTIQLDRNIDWTCNPITEYPEYQYPIVCSDNNRYIPEIFTINNETIGDKIIVGAPTLDVNTMMVLVKSTTLPLESVNLPSSRTCSRVLKISGWAFSTSSNKTTE